MQQEWMPTNPCVGCEFENDEPPKDDCYECLEASQYGCMIIAQKQLLEYLIEDASKAYQTAEAYTYIYTFEKMLKQLEKKQ